MNKHATWIIALIGLMSCSMNFTVLSQAPPSFKYQAVARDKTGQVLASQDISLQVSILQSTTDGPEVYREVHSVTTSEQGLINVAVGRGKGIAGSMAAIDWGGGSHFLRIEMDPSGGTNYELMGVSELLSVPYAFYAAKSGSGERGDDFDWEITGGHVITGHGGSYPAGNVGIGNNAPGTLLYVAKNMGEPTITIRNLGGGGGATYAMVDDLSGADWKFKATTYGGFKIRDHANLMDVAVFEPNSAANSIYIKSGGNVGVGKNNPGTKLDVNGVITSNGGNSDQWNAAYGWGDHTTAGYLTSEVDSSTSNELQTLSVTGDQLTISSGNTVTVPGDDWGDQVVSTNATLAGDGTASNVLKIAQQGATTGQALTWNGTTWVPCSATTTGWELTGNAGTNPAVNFVGTTDNQPLRFKVNSQYAGEVNPINNNTFLGTKAGANSTGSFNVAVGAGSLYNDTDRSHLVAVGDSALYNNSVGASQSWQAICNTAVGSRALRFNTTGHQNTATGFQALYSNTSGDCNTTIGYKALYTNTTGNTNTAGGMEALYSNTTGNSNTAYGYVALGLNTSGHANTAIGSRALEYNETGNFNTATGHESLWSNETGENNTAIGYGALRENYTGYSNTACGDNALISNYYGYTLTALGASTDVGSSSLSNAMVLGYGAIVNTSNKIRVGNAAVTVIEGQVDWSWPSDARFKQNITESVQGLAFILQLRPVVYNFDTRKFTEFLMKDMPDSLRNERLNEQDFTSSKAIRHSGFVAQEVVQAAAACGYDFDGVHVPADDNDNYSIAYSQFVVPLVKAIQEQQAMIEQLRQKVEALETQRGK
ncbi:MAG TPA: tail fiber domain-containing protein [Bacteroidales bacterium]|nr:tail fiber domain-containing protein [Bacteroidales bacterium]HNS46064.1 tail fiber domain-containing protein [Bacteroidales bacterium]